MMLIPASKANAIIRYLLLSVETKNALPIWKRKRNGSPNILIFKKSICKAYDLSSVIGCSIIGAINHVIKMPAAANCKHILMPWLSMLLNAA